MRLAERWQWRSDHGQWKTRSALAVLAELERRGQIQLPPSRIRVRTPGPVLPSVACGVEVSLTGPVGEYRPFQWELVSSASQRREWRELLQRHHYLGAPALVGANLKYLVRGRGGELLAVLGWHAAVERLRCRDEWIGWDAAQRAGLLRHLANNARFLVLPWVRVKNLASAILSEGVKILARDWLQRYGVELWLLESFIDPSRFRGTCYRAANWTRIGWTEGYAKRQGQFIYHGQSKEVHVYVLEKRLRRLVGGDQTQPLLTPAFLLAQRLKPNPKPSARRKQMSEQVMETWTPRIPPKCDLTPEDLECVRQEFNEFSGLFEEAFGRIETFELSILYLQGLLSDVERKNIEAMALKLHGPEKVRALQRFLSQYQWDEEWLRQRHWELSAEALSDPEGVWSIDASEMAKKGSESVGVAPQYCGSLGKTANCQSGVYVCYSSPKGHALLDSRLYLPQCWLGEAYAERRKQCHVPSEVTFKTKPELALGLFRKLWQSRLFAGSWVTCDCSFGNNEDFLEGLPRECCYLAEIACTRKVWLKEGPRGEQLESESCTVEALLEQPGFLHWCDRKVSEGEKGPIVASFARLRVYLEAERSPQSERTLLLRNEPGGKIKYALSNAPEETPLREWVRVSGSRWPIERCFEEDKSELGLDHYEHRSWQGWHRHMRLVFLAQLFLLRLRQKYKKSPGINPLASTATP
jgi:SRSO17 transposase